jgi:ubiquinone/menaquinone biosynthesis C-methylase UbiE
MVDTEQVSAAFSKQSAVFDELEKNNPIIRWMRERVWKHVLSFWQPGGNILELNAGTGIDAVFFARQGFHMHATDNAEGMINELKSKVLNLNLQDKISVEKCSFEELQKLDKNGFDHIFSNFGGLNCTDKLDSVINSFLDLLKPGGTATLVIMPPICPWELALALKGNTKVAFRRLKKGGTNSNVEGISFKSFYYRPSEVIKMFGKQYKTVSIESLGSIVPPPYLEKVPARYPTLFRGLTKLEESLGNAWPFNSWADHFIITMQRL